MKMAHILKTVGHGMTTGQWTRDKRQWTVNDDKRTLGHNDMVTTMRCRLQWDTGDVSWKSGTQNQN